MPGPALLPAPLLGWLDRVLAGQEIRHAKRLAGGYSSGTILITTGAGDSYALRRCRRAGQCAVEAALAGRLRGVVPVAEVVAADPDGTGAGEPVLLSRFVPGVLLSRALAAGGRQDAAGLGRAAGAALAAIGSVRFGSGGFFGGADLVPRPDAGVPDGLPEFVDRCLRDGNASRGLSPGEQDGLRDLAAAAAPLLAAVAGARQLVHADYNAKNLLMTAGTGGWSVSAVLDWEFAYSGSPLADIGNMLRFGEQIPAPFADSFIAGYVAAGGELPARWRELSEALDLFALADFLTRPPDHRYFGKAVAVIRDRLQAGGS
jgi:aminoglycoside phosphotransferase (APT) family kinase protein